MTDLFVSASAALLMVIVLSHPDTPLPLPVQTDLIALCPAPPGAHAPFTLFPASALKPKAEGGVELVGPGVAFADVEGLALALGSTVAPVELFFTLGLTGAPGRPLPPECLRRLKQGIVSPYNDRTAEGDFALGGAEARPALRSVLGVQVLHLPWYDGVHHD
ncbi:MAG: hypothetical protein ACFCBW_15245 [Candidatus Competibacterales bacterium]